MRCYRLSRIGNSVAPKRKHDCPWRLGSSVVLKMKHDCRSSLGKSVARKMECRSRPFLVSLKGLGTGC